VSPDAGALAAGRYPMARPLLVITDGEPEPAARRLIDLLLGPRGQALVERHGYLRLGRAEAPER
jgi:phosphate transport system substrate-binding protein